jgi:hypothetical protein
MDEMKRLFEEDVQDTVGNTLHYLQTSRTQAFIGIREPIKVSTFPDDRMLYVYDYWKGIKIVIDGPCTVYLYINQSTKYVTEASSEGTGCYRAY